MVQNTEKDKKVFYIFGSGGHAKSCIEVIESNKSYKIDAVVYKNKKPSDPFFSKFRLIKESELHLNYKKSNAIIGIGQIKTNLPRKDLFKLLKKKKFILEPVFSVTAYISKISKINEGTIVMHHSFIGPNTKVGKNCIINTGSIIEHDVKIGDHCHISTGCKINGNVSISNNCFIGSGTIIKEGVKINSGKIIPMGSVIKKNV